MWATFAAGDPWASMPTASITASGPRPSVRDLDRVDKLGGVVEVVEIDDIDHAVTARCETLRDQIDADDVVHAEMLATRHDMSPIGPRPSTTTDPSFGTAAYWTACHAVGSTSDRNR